MSSFHYTSMIAEIHLTREEHVRAEDILFRSEPGKNSRDDVIASLNKACIVLEFLLNLGVGPASLHRLDYLALEVDAAFNNPENAVARAEHAGKQLKFLVEKVVNALLRFVAEVQHVDHGHVDLLAVTV